MSDTAEESQVTVDSSSENSSTDIPRDEGILLICEELVSLTSEILTKSECREPCILCFIVRMMSECVTCISSFRNVFEESSKVLIVFSLLKIDEWRASLWKSVLLVANIIL